MNKIEVNMQVLDMEFKHSEVRTCIIETVDDLYRFRRMKLEGYKRVLATVYIECLGHTVQIVSSTHRIGQSVFKVVENVVFSTMIHDILG